MSYAPKNVRDLVAANTRYAKLGQQQQSEQRAAIIAKWSDRDSKRTAAGPGTPPYAYNLTGTTEDRQAGITAGLATVKAARQARLRELFEHEALMYEDELNAMGLSLVKPRD